MHLTLPPQVRDQLTLTLVFDSASSLQDLKLAELISVIVPVFYLVENSDSKYQNGSGSQPLIELIGTSVLSLSIFFKACIFPFDEFLLCDCET